MKELVLVAIIYTTGPIPSGMNSDCIADGHAGNGKLWWKCYIYETPKP